MPVQNYFFDRVGGWIVAFTIAASAGAVGYLDHGIGFGCVSAFVGLIITRVTLALPDDLRRKVPAIRPRRGNGRAGDGHDPENDV